VSANKHERLFEVQKYTRIFFLQHFFWATENSTGCVIFITIKKFIKHFLCPYLLRLYGPHGEGKYRSMGNLKIGIKRGNLLRKWRGLRVKGINKLKKAHRNLIDMFRLSKRSSQLEENKCMLIQNIDSAIFTVCSYTFILF
jgi:hypothetical protein